MIRRLAPALALVVGLAALVPAADQPKGSEVKYQIHNGYFESNKSGLKGEASYLAFTDKAAFDRTFGVARTMGPKPNYLPGDAFDSRLAVAVIKRGNAITTYDLHGVTAADGVLKVFYTAKTKEGGGTARYASPLILSVDKGKYKSVEFIENGKKVGTATIGK